MPGFAPAWILLSLSLSLALSAACGDGASPLPAPDGNSPELDAPAPTDPGRLDGIGSGSRLKVEWHVVDGTKVLAGLHDSVRNERCAARPFADGQTYCAPTAAEVVYRDAACTQPLGLQRIGCGQPQLAYFVESDQTSCGGPARKLYPRGAAVTVTSYYSRFLGSCSTASSTQGFQVFELGAELPLTELVSLTAPVPAGAGRVTQRFFEAADGARVPAGLHDRQLETDCRMMPEAYRSTARCVPAGASASAPGSGPFGDAGCAMSLTSHLKSCPAPKVALLLSSQCLNSGRIPEAFLNGAAAAPPYYRRNGGNQCATTTLNSDLGYSLLGAPVELAAGSRAPAAAGAGRYRVMYTSAGEAPVREQLLFDTELETECQLLPHQDNSLRCVPISPYSTRQVFSDPACTIEQWVLNDSSPTRPDCTSPPMPRLAVTSRTVGAPSCTVTNDIRPVAGLLPQPTYRRAKGNACIVDAPAFTLYGLGAPVPTSSLPAATSLIEP